MLKSVNNKINGCKAILIQIIALYLPNSSDKQIRLSRSTCRAPEETGTGYTNYKVTTNDTRENCFDSDTTHSP